MSQYCQGLPQTAPGTRSPTGSRRGEPRPCTRRPGFTRQNDFRVLERLTVSQRRSIP